MRLAILLSGRGSNFQAIHEAIERGALDAEIVCVISNRPDAAGIEKARGFGYETHVLDHKTFPHRAAHEAEVLRVLDAAHPDFVVLAGYMRLLGATFVQHYHHRILNIHPSLLPAFPGVDAQAQAVAYGVKVSGCTVHFVDEHLDHGPIVMQEAVHVLEDDTVEALSLRILGVEHRIYPEAVRLVVEGRVRIEGRRAIVAARTE